jgi:hypothetical protein
MLSKGGFLCAQRKSFPDRLNDHQKSPLEAHNARELPTPHEKAAQDAPSLLYAAH